MSMFGRHESVDNIIYRGKETYEEFLAALKEFNAPKLKEEFFIFFIRELYDDQDFFNLVTLIDRNKDKYTYQNSAQVLKLFSDEIHNDYVISLTGLEVS